MPRSPAHQRLTSATSFAAAAILLLAPRFAAAGTLRVYHVDTTTDTIFGANVCSDTLGADCSLRGAIELANSDGDPSRIILGDHVYQLTLPGADEENNQTGDLDIEGADSLEIVADTGAHPIVEQATDDRIFDVGGGVAFTLTGPMTLRGGVVSSSTSTEDRGGQILIQGTTNLTETLTLTGIALEGGQADDDGGCLFAFADQVTLTDVTVTSCSSGDAGGGAYLNVDDGTAALLRTTWRNNTAEGSGGGLLIDFDSADVGSGTIDDSIFRGNQAATGNGTSGSGGGLRHADGTLDVKRSEFSQNSAGNPTSGNGNGGGVSSSGGTLKLENVTVSRNTIDGSFNQGVGIHSTSNLSLRMVTVFEPTARQDFVEAAVSLGSQVQSVVFDHSILVGGCYQPTASPPAPPLASLGGNVEQPATDDTSGATTCNLLNSDDFLVADAELLPLAPYGSERRTHGLTATSPALDLGSFITTGCPSTDQRGASRSLLGPCDSGAHEFDPDQPPPVVLLFADGFQSGNTSAWSVSVP